MIMAKCQNDELQRKQLDDMMKRPIPKKRVGIVHLQMVKESRVLYGMKRFQSAEEAVEVVKPLCEKSDRELMLVMSLNAKLEPLAVEIVAVGGISSCIVDVKNIFKHSLLNNAAYVICFHNHPSGKAEPSENDRKVTKQIGEAGLLLGIPLIDHIIIGEDEYYSFRNSGEVISVFQNEF